MNNKQPEAPPGWCGKEVLSFLFHDADTQAGIRGTAWGGYQAVAEYVDK